MFKVCGSDKKEHVNGALIKFCGQPMVVCCDAQCQRAFGRDAYREDDQGFLVLREPYNSMESAPAESDVTEGGQGKPESSSDFPNQWCVRQCERCHQIDPRTFIEVYFYKEDK